MIRVFASVLKAWPKLTPRQAGLNITDFYLLDKTYKHYID